MSRSERKSDRRILHSKGCLVFESEELQFAAEKAVEALAEANYPPRWERDYAQPRVARDGRKFHISLATKHDYPQLCRHYQTDNVAEALTLAAKSAEAELLSSLMLDLGLGSCKETSNNSECYYKVLCWPAATLWRCRHSLPPKDFHVTLGYRFADVHTIRKDQSTLCCDPPLPACGANLEHFEGVIKEVFQCLQTNVPGSQDELTRVIDMLVHAGKASGDVNKEILALRTRCKLLANQRRFEDVVQCAGKILTLSDTTSKNIPVRALRGLALVHLERYSEALGVLEETVSLMSRKTSPKRVELLRAASQCRGYLGLREPFTKFPRTAHLFDAGGKAVTRDDLLVKDLDFFVDGKKVIVVEEKIDGANVGFSVSATGQLLCQNRSHYVSAASQSQFQKLSLWLEEFGSSLRNILEPSRHILFGEWCAMVHSLQYTRLPGYFIAFDLYDNYTETFATRKELHTLLKPTGIPVVPIVCKQSFSSKKELLSLLETSSHFRDGTVEGIYLRYECEGQEARRCKLVRPDFVSGMELHWSAQIQKKNLVCQDMAATYDGYQEAEVEGSQDPTVERSALFDPRERVTVELDDRKVALMRNFSFLLPKQLAVSSTPKKKEHIDALRCLGVTLVITLTEEEPLDPSWFGNGIENLFVPVPNYCPPSLDQMEMIFHCIQQAVEGGGSVMVHCGGGKGRAGTVAACLLVRFGQNSIPPTYINRGSEMNSKEAIEYLRSVRPGSLETAQQEEFVQQYTQHVWKEFAEEVDDGNTEKQSTDDVSQEVAEENGKNRTTQSRSVKEFERQLKLRQRRAPDIVVLVGIPGSGKSTFSKPLEASGWKRISQDDSGRKCCEDMAGRFSKVGKVVLDRCNVEASERQYWLDLMHNPNPKRCAAVYFDFTPEECIERVRARQNHPTIRAGTKGSERIVRGFYERLEVPSAQLENFGRIFVVRSLDDTKKILSDWGVRSDDT